MDHIYKYVVFLRHVWKIDGIVPDGCVFGLVLHKEIEFILVLPTTTSNTVENFSLWVEAKITFSGVKQKHSSLWSNFNETIQRKTGILLQKLFLLKI